MKAIHKTNHPLAIILLIVFFGACSTKKQLTSSSTNAVAVDTATHTTAFQSLKPKPYHYSHLTYNFNTQPTPKPKVVTTKDVYEFAFDDLKAMLDGKQTVDFEKAIFITENVYYRNKVKYGDYLRVLYYHTKRINALITANDKSASMDFKVYANFRERGLSYTSLRYTESEKKELYRKALTNWAIFTYLTDTLSFSKKEHLPFAYQIDDPFGMDNWSNSQVLHLLGSMEKKGNCFALVALYKIFANRLNSEAYICTAPQHIYLQHRDEKGDFYNLELATKTYPSDGTLMTLTFTHKEAIMSGISLRRLKTEKQNIVLCLVNLGKSYEHKFGTREDDFMLKCAELALQHDSLNLNAMLLKQQVLEERVMKYASNNNITSIETLQANATFKQLETHTLHLYDKGYHQMPLYMQEIILSKLQQDNKPLVIKDRTPNPFTSIKVPAKNRRYSTLSGGLYEEVHAPKQLEEYGYFVLDTKNRKLVTFAENTNKELLIDPVVFAWQVDPMAHERVSWTPYNAFRNNPILNIDPTGALDNPVYDPDGNFLGTDDQGISGTAIIMDKSKFTQGMKHEDAEKYNQCMEGLKTPEAKQKFANHYFDLYKRPDFDGFLTIPEGVAWAKAHPNLDNDNNESNGLGNATPNDFLYLDASKLNFGSVRSTDLSLNQIKGINLLYFTDFGSTDSRATTYALGQTKLKLLDASGTVEVINGPHNIYNWDYGGGLLRKTLIGGDRLLKGLNDSHGFPLYIFGKGKLNPIPKPSGIRFNAY